MQVTNRRQYSQLEWKEYAAIKGYSYSGIKNEGKPPFKASDKMRFGSLVDEYLFTPESYNGEQRSLVVPVAKELQKVLGGAILSGKPQLSVTANFEQDGLVMPFKGRLDLHLPGLVIDLKVSELHPIKAIQYFRYDWQMAGYCAATDSKKSIIISINPKTFKISMVPITPNYDFWEYHVKRLGTPLNVAGRITG